jgi:hypothetical protein
LIEPEFRGDGERLEPRERDFRKPHAAVTSCRACVPSVD